MLRELSSEELAAELRDLPEWEISVSELPGKEPLQRTELKRTYKFTSFEDAIAFMNIAARHISEIQHHPRWENIWRNLTVWLSTWDTGFKPSRFDIELAHFMDDLYQNFRSK